MELCSGGILGLGETWEQRLELAYELRELDPDEIPLNFLNPRPGTPLAGRRPIEAKEALRAIAIFRLVFPDKIIRYAGGRELVLRDAQALGLVGGINGMIVGNYLTTAGPPGGRGREARRGPRAADRALHPRGRRDRRTVNGRELLALDRRHVWHPYAAMPGRHEPLVVESASGVRLTLGEPVHGRTELIDGMSSWWSAIHGYRHPALDAAVVDQVGRMSHVMFGGLTHEPAIGLARRLVEITPAPLQHVFLADSGSVSVEVAVKMCLQYQRSRGRPRPQPAADLARRLLRRHAQPDVALRSRGRHAPPLDRRSCRGRCSPTPRRTGSTRRPTRPTSRTSPTPSSATPTSSRRSSSSRSCRGRAGCASTAPRYCAALREIADAHDVLLVFDEIATGFGRTGAMFAADHAGRQPRT